MIPEPRVNTRDVAPWLARGVSVAAFVSAVAAPVMGAPRPRGARSTASCWER
jgi:hypothetical protein